MLENIHSPKDLQNLKEEEIPFLCSEIRTYIKKIININGGHLASSLGAVELIVAMHRSFNMPIDKFIFDVGHQSYAHKILTGRYYEFKNIRKFNGISGFPKKEESIYDSFGTGHSSTSLSAALGIATARDIKKKKFNIIVNIGDGALGGGIALEAMNHIGHLKSKLIVILNDNDMSISKNTGAISMYLSKLTSKKIYLNFKEKIKLKFSKSEIGLNLKRFLSNFKKNIKYFFINKGVFFEELGFNYFGPYDGHDVNTLEKELTSVKAINGPVLFHVITKKGKGSIEAEKNPEKFHGISAIKEKKIISLTNYFSKYLIELAKENKKITAITAAMSYGTGLNLFKKKYPERFFDVGIAEQHALTFAAGQSIEGLHPFVAIYSTFMQRGVDQVIHDICLQNLPVTMILDRAGLVGEDGETHHGIFDISLFGTIPNLVFMEPKDFFELKEMLYFSLKYKGPTMIRFSKSISNSNLKTTEKLLLGEMEYIIKNNNSIAIISLGREIEMALYIYKYFKKEKIDLDVINARFITPINKKWIKILNNYKIIITIENHVKIGGFGSILKSQIDNTNILNLGIPNIFVKHGTIKELRKDILFNKKNIIESIKKYIYDKKN